MRKGPGARSGAFRQSWEAAYSPPSWKVIGTRTVAPPTASPLTVFGLIRNSRESWIAARPKPAPDGLSDATLQPVRLPLSVTLHEMVARP